MSIKYILCPGNVTSLLDGRVHHINAKQLAKLYRVPMSECVTLPRDHDLKGWQAPAGAVYLLPCHDGNYTIPSTNQEKTR